MKNTINGMTPVDIEINGFGEIPTCYVTWTLSGNYYPQTETSPEEYPEIEIEKLFIEDIDMTVILNNPDITAELVEQVMASLEEEH
jgi:hypothetical protein